MPTLSDSLPEDVWNYEDVLRDNGVQVDWCLQGWFFTWGESSTLIGQTLTPTIARRLAALFVTLRLYGISTPMCLTLMEGYGIILDRQEPVPENPFGSIYALNDGTVLEQ